MAGEANRIDNNNISFKDVFNESRRWADSRRRHSLMLLSVNSSERFRHVLLLIKAPTSAVRPHIYVLCLPVFYCRYFSASCPDWFFFTFYAFVKNSF